MGLHYNNPEQFIRSSSGMAVKIDVIRHTVTVGEAAVASFTEAWAKTTKAKFIGAYVTIFPPAANPASMQLSRNYGMWTLFDGSDLIVSDDTNTIANTDIVTILIFYEE